MAKRFKDLTGQRFGRLVVQNYSGQSKNKMFMFDCLCDCGNKKRLRGNHLERGEITSCGCFRKTFKMTHGHTAMGHASGTYGSWASMVDRATNPNNKRFKDYLGRGIGVCDRWLSFENFLSDVGGRPNGTTLERIDNNLGYFPGNVKWATRSEQQRNRRTNHLVTFKGETHCIAEWAELVGLRFSTLFTRLKRGWSEERALTTPV